MLTEVGKSRRILEKAEKITLNERPSGGTHPDN
jgi:hypothetical protein